MQRFLTTEYIIAYFLSLLIWAKLFIVPVAPFLILSVALVFCDLFTGTKAAKKRGEKVTSRGFLRTVQKLVLYFISILLGEGMRLVFFPSLPVTYAVAFAICITEFQSTIENVEALTGVNIWTRIKDFVSHLKLQK